MSFSNFCLYSLSLSLLCLLLVLLRDESFYSFFLFRFSTHFWSPPPLLTNHLRCLCISLFSINVYLFFWHIFISLSLSFDISPLTLFVKSVFLFFSSLKPLACHESFRLIQSKRAFTLNILNSAWFKVIFRSHDVRLSVIQKLLFCRAQLGRA